MRAKKRAVLAHAYYTPIGWALTAISVGLKMFGRNFSGTHRSAIVTLGRIDGAAHLMDRLNQVLENSNIAAW